MSDLSYTLYHGDCLEVMKTLPDNSVDSIDDYKNEEWLRTKLVNENVSMSEIARQFNKDTTTIRYWRDKFNIKVVVDVKYPICEYTCPVCNKKFKKRVIKESQSIYCSNNCAYIGRGLGYTKRNVKDGYNTSPTIIKKNCEFCGKEFSVTKSRKRIKYCSKECVLSKSKENMIGDKNHAWTGGRSYDKRCYRGTNWNEQRIKCYKRDNFTCQMCGEKCIPRSSLNDDNGSRIIQCHHIKKYENESSNDLDNLTTLCASCHSKIHKKHAKYEHKQKSLFD